MANIDKIDVDGTVYDIIDKKVEITTKNDSSQTIYYPTFVNYSGTKGININDGIRYATREGTTSQDGQGILIVGNNIPSGTDGNKKGYARIYNKNSNYANLVYHDSATANSTHTLPATGGILVNSASALEANRLYMGNGTNTLSTTRMWHYTDIITVPQADNFEAGWRRFAKVTSTGYGNAILSFRGGWSTSAPLVCSVFLSIRLNDASLRIIGGMPNVNNYHTKLRAVRSSANNFYLELYREASSTTNTTQYCDVLSLQMLKISETSDNPPINNNPTGANDFELDLKKDLRYLNRSDSPEISEDLSDLEDTTSTDITSLEGNPLNFSTKSAQYAQDCNIEMNPIQDLHGYGKPWVGGAGKNKLRMSVADVKSANTGGTWSGDAYTINSITYTLITDSDGYCIGTKARGKATSEAYFNFPFFEASIPAGDYYYSGCPSGGGSSTYDLFGWDRDTNARAKQWDGTTNVVSDFGDGNSKIKVVSGGRYLLRFRMRANYDSSSADVYCYPMIRPSTETDKTWQPYENICAIYPYTSLDVEMVGKNQFDIANPKYPNTLYDSNGSLVESALYDTYEFFGGYQYALSYTKGSSFDYIRYGFNDGARSLATTTPLYIDARNKSVLLISLKKDANFISNVQLELGTSASSVTNYSAYESTTIPISFDSIAPYGGTLDVRTGKLTVDRGVIDIGSLTNWEYLSANAYFRAQIVGKAYNQNNICTCYYLDTASVVSMANGTFKGSINNDYVYVKDLRYTDVNTFKTALTGQKIVYELVTPTTHYLTPHEVNLLLSVNNLRAWAINSAQSIKDTAYCLFKNLVYRNGVMASLADVMGAVESIKKDWITSGTVWSKTSGENAVLVHALGSKYQDYAISCVIASTDYETYGFFFEVTDEKYRYIQELDGYAYVTFTLDNIVAKHLITNKNRVSNNMISATIIFADGTSTVPEHCAVYVRIYKR